MSGRLVGEVHAWLRTPAARGLDLNVSQRMVLTTIAERANERTREMWSHTGDGCTQFEYLMEVTGLRKSALAAALNGLAEKELDVRIEIGVTKSGCPVFAHRSRAMRFKLPDLPVSISLPGPPDDTPPNPVDNMGDNPVDNGPPDPESLQSPGPITRGSLQGTGPIRPKASGQPDPNGLKPPGNRTPVPRENPSTTNPSPPMDPTHPAEEEDTHPATATPPANTSHHMGWEPTYREAVEFLFTLTNEGQEFMDAAAQQLGPGAPIADRVILAARLAKEGIPA
jgi:hypothetical protein